MGQESQPDGNVWCRKYSVPSNCFEKMHSPQIFKSLPREIFLIPSGQFTSVPIRSKFVVPLRRNDLSSALAGVTEGSHSSRGGPEPRLPLTSTLAFEVSLVNTREVPNSDDEHAI